MRQQRVRVRTVRARFYIGAEGKRCGSSGARAGEAGADARSTRSSSKLANIISLLIENPEVLPLLAGGKVQVRLAKSTITVGAERFAHTAFCIVVVLRIPRMASDDVHTAGCNSNCRAFFGRSAKNRLPVCWRKRLPGRVATSSRCREIGYGDCVRNAACCALLTRAAPACSGTARRR